MTTKSTRILLAAVLMAGAGAALLATPANAAATLSDAVARHLQEAETARYAEEVTMKGREDALHCRWPKPPRMATSTPTPLPASSWRLT